MPEQERWGERFQCLECSKTYKTKKGLDNHIASKHPRSSTVRVTLLRDKKKAPPGGGYS